MPAQMYDWDRWFARRRFTLRRGIDYEATQGSMLQQVRNAASHRGIGITVLEGYDYLTVLVRTRGQRGGERRPADAST